MTVDLDDTDPRDPSEPDEAVAAPPPAKGPSASAGWLKMISDAEATYRDYQTRADAIDKLYANLEQLANKTRDREMQLFWANISVMAPSVYSRPPVPVVTPRFRVDDELKRVASEVLERATSVTFEKENVDGEMRLIRDDLVILARGAAWIRYDTTEGEKRVCIDHADRKDFLCESARKWKDVDWCAKRSWLTRSAAKKRFMKSSKLAYQELNYSVRKDAESDTDDGASKAGIWELWCKSLNKVVWVSEGADVCLDEGEPHLNLESFFPCPRPAFATVERRSLVPVPDMLFYKDQLEEINEVTARISSLTESIRVRGFYPSGQGEVSDAIEAAMKTASNNTVLVPIANWAGIGAGGVKDMVLWWPLEQIVLVVKELIALRKELIQDVYEVTGLSDIMRGQTEASETLGAQQLKSQYGSVRIKDRQDELTRVARDITRISAEIMAENFDTETLNDMSQMALPTDADIAAKAKPLQVVLAKIAAELPALQKEMQTLQAEIAQAAQDPEVHQMAQAAPDKAQQIMGAVQQKMQADQAKAQQMQQAGQQAQAQLQELEQTVTIDKVVKLLRDQKLRPFMLDIETDSTITPDENASKQRVTEFVTAVGGYMKNALPLVEQMPQAAAMVAETLKFVSGQYRAGRELQSVIDKFADQMKAKAEQPPQPSPEAIKAEADAKAAQAKAQQDAEAHQAKMQQDHDTTQADVATKQAQAAKDAADAQATEAEAQARTIEAQTAARDAEVKRKIDVQRELDASDARKADIADKSALAALQRVVLQEKHAQDLEKGVLEIEAIKGKIAHQAVATAGTIAKDDKAIEVKQHAIDNPPKAKEPA